MSMIQKKGIHILLKLFSQVVFLYITALPSSHPFTLKKAEIASPK